MKQRDLEDRVTDRLMATAWIAGGLLARHDGWSADAVAKKANAVYDALRAEAERTEAARRPPTTLHPQDRSPASQGPASPCEPPGLLFDDEAA